MQVSGHSRVTGRVRGMLRRLDGGFFGGTVGLSRGDTLQIAAIGTVGEGPRRVDRCPGTAGRSCSKITSTSFGAPDRIASNLAKLVHAQLEVILRIDRHVYQYRRSVTLGRFVETIVFDTPSRHHRHPSN